MSEYFFLQISLFLPTKTNGFLLLTKTNIVL